jgi:ribosomal protein S18 acetylase RimI-like enzyme
MSHQLALVDHPGEDIRSVILEGLRDFNVTEVAPGHRIETLAVAIRDGSAGPVLGGLWGRTGMGWLTIELIFVPEYLRGQHVARRLIALAEAEALRRECHSAWLETLNVRARALYEHLGFVPFGELQDFPRGNSRVFLKKTLSHYASV